MNTTLDLPQNRLGLKKSELSYAKFLVCALWCCVDAAEFTPLNLATVLGFVEFPFMTVKPNQFVQCKDGGGSLYGRVVCLLRVQEDSDTTFGNPEEADVVILRLYKLRNQDPHTLRSYITPTQNTSLTLVNNIKYHFNVVPQDLDYYVELCNLSGSWTRAHWESWESKEYSGKLLYVPRF